MRGIHTTAKKYMRSGLLLLCVGVYVLAPGSAINVSATISPRGIESFADNQGFYDPSTDCTNASGEIVNAVAQTGAAITTSASELANAKTIMGIAKTYNLGEAGALVGLITAMQESVLKIFASKKSEISQQNPVWLALQPKKDDGSIDKSHPYALGNDHDSVGIMQQRFGSGWSTFGSGDEKDIVYQLMDPAYAAQAFFGTPKGANLPNGLKNPGALKKGLQNVDGWQDMEPGRAAQSVQISAFPDAYTKHIKRAQGLLTKYWSTVPAIPLPISITGGGAPGASTTPQTTAVSTAGCASSTTTAVSDGDWLKLLVQYAENEYHEADYFRMMPAYEAAVKSAQKNGGYVGGGPHPGVDCGGFVTILMRNSGRDKTYNKQNGPTGAQEEYLRNSDKWVKVIGTDKNRVNGGEDLQAGDVAIIGSEHTYIYTGKFVFTNPQTGKSDKWVKDSASASYMSWRTPMASNAYDFERYDWYRLKTEPAKEVQI